MTTLVTPTSRIATLPNKCLGQSKFKVAGHKFGIAFVENGKKSMHGSKFKSGAVSSGDRQKLP
jgi:hypothetical protein